MEADAAEASGVEEDGIEWAHPDLTSRLSLRSLAALQLDATFQGGPVLDTSPMTVKDQVVAVVQVTTMPQILQPATLTEISPDATCGRADFGDTAN